MPSPPFDPRITPARPDLAAKHLEGRVPAARYVRGELREVIEPQAPMRRSPSPEAPLDTEALRGERVTVYEVEEGWAWGQLADDGYVGYLPANALGPPGPDPTHRVTALRTFVFPAPNIKTTPLAALPFGSRVAIARNEPPFAVPVSGGYIPLPHLARVDEYERDHVAIAERFLGAPYLWGGKTALGIDCSGLVQLALAATGLPCPRDSDLQEQALGVARATETALSDLRRGDLLFWQGHVAIARDDTTLIHANASHMAVAIEAVRKALARIAAAGGVLVSIKRLGR